TQQWEDYANFVDCTMFGNRAASVSRFLSKGSKVAIEGKLRWSQWQAQDGGKRSKLEVVVDELEFMTSRDGGQQPQPPQGMQPGTAQAYAAMGAQPQTVAYDDEIPF
ncbi:single-stranded DNA-binding protein, partial [Paratractidigestivibacter sp.]|uniref:single-stranded DNA-binding protein n=1 Tax=Paratractidigestivibacter sp. TaxID=2847316 RepID=UPI003AB83851